MPPVLDSGPASVLTEYPPPQPLSVRGGDDLPGQGGVLHLSRRPAGQQQRRLLLREFSQDEKQDESCQSQKLGTYGIPGLTFHKTQWCFPMLLPNVASQGCFPMLLPNVASQFRFPN